ncbi:MAG: hypothetical protein ACXAEU_07260 [Candidatus Hodarchaeales archaeon]
MDRSSSVARTGKKQPIKDPPSHRSFDFLSSSCSTLTEITIVKFLLDHGPATRSEVVETTGLEWTSAHCA